MANPQSWNLYAYVHGNPVNLNDPTGHMPRPPGLMWALVNGRFGDGGASDGFGSAMGAVGDYLQAPKIMRHGLITLSGGAHIQTTYSQRTSYRKTLCSYNGRWVGLTTCTTELITTKSIVDAQGNLLNWLQRAESGCTGMSTSTCNSISLLSGPSVGTDKSAAGPSICMAGAESHPGKGVSVMVAPGQLIAI